MSAKILEANGKPAFAVLPIKEYRALLEQVEDAQDAAALVRAAARREDETIPVAVIDRLLAGDAPIRVWREHRGLSAAALAKQCGVTAAHVSKLESKKGEPSVALLRKLARVLDVDMELLAGA